MINTKKKLGAFLIAMMMVLPLFAFVTMVETKAALQGNGTADDPYQITSVNDFIQIDSGRDKHYILKNDLDFNGTGVMIGGENGPWFSGSLDGNGHVIKNLTLNNRNTARVALFRRTEGATIKNLRMENAVITADQIAGVLVGDALNTRIENCYSLNGTVTVISHSNVGGLCGAIANDSVVNKCFTTGTVTSKTSNAGGIAGSVRDSEIRDSYSSCNVSGVTLLGGLVGSVSMGEIANCYTTGEVNGGSVIGSIAGYNAGSIINSVAISSTITATGNNEIARIAVPYNYENGDFLNCLALDNMMVIHRGNQIDLGSTNPSANSSHGLDTSMENLKQQSTYEALGWDFDNVWYMDGYPKLQFAREGETTDPDPDPDTEMVTLNDTVTGTDNNQIEYSGNWFYQNQSGNYMDDEHVTNTPDSYFQVRFNGNQIKWYGAFALDRGVAAVYIDDEFVQYVNCYDPNYQPGALLFDSGTIDTGQHTLKVVLIPFKYIEATNHYITVDKIEIESNK